MLDSSDRIDRQIDLWSTVVLTIASVLTAWSAFQSTKWTGLRAIAFNEASAVRVDANRASNLANEQTEVDVELFVAWLEATAIDQKVRFLADDVEAGVEPASGAERIAAADKLKVHDGSRRIAHATGSFDSVKTDVTDVTASGRHNH